MIIKYLFENNLIRKVMWIVGSNKLKNINEPHEEKLGFLNKKVFFVFINVTILSIAQAFVSYASRAPN